MVVEAVAPPELAQDGPAEDDEQALPTVLAALLQRAHEQHERMRRRFCWTTMPSLLEAAKDADLPAAQRLLASGANPDAPTQIVDAAGGGRAAWRPLHFACRCGSLEVVAALLAAGARPAALAPEAGGAGAAVGLQREPPSAVAERHGHLRCALLLQLHQGSPSHPSPTAAAPDALLGASVGDLENRWASRFRELEEEQQELRRRAEWAEGVLQARVQAMARQAEPEPEAPEAEGGQQEEVQGQGQQQQQQQGQGRRRVCPVCMDKPRGAAMIP